MVRRGRRPHPAMCTVSGLALAATACFVAMPHDAVITSEQVIATSVSPLQVAGNGLVRLLLDTDQEAGVTLGVAIGADCFVRYRDTVARHGVKVIHLESLLGGARAGFAWSLLYSASLGALAGLALDRNHDRTGVTLLGFAAIPWAMLPWAALRARDRRFDETVVVEHREGTPCTPPRELSLRWTPSLTTHHPADAGGRFSVTLPSPEALGLEGFDLPVPVATLILDGGAQAPAELGFELGDTTAAAAWRRAAAGAAGGQDLPP